MIALTTCAPASPVVVVNTDDAGPGSFRQAIIDANADSSPAPVAINFNIPGPGPHRIAPVTPLPEIVRTVHIDGYTQPGSQPNSLVNGNNASLGIELDGRATDVAVGLLIWAGSAGTGDPRGSVVKGLAIFGFKAPLIRLGVLSDGCTIHGNFIGLDAGGVKRTHPSNAPSAGIYLEASFGHLIGGTNPADRNVISGNDGGIGSFGSPHPFAQPDHSLIRNNYIGTDLSGTQPIGNKNYGVWAGEPLFVIGGFNPNEGNVIAFNDGAGVLISGRGRSVFIAGNSIFGNTQAGISGGPLGPELISAAGTSVKGRVIGAVGSTFRIEVFANDECATGTNGQGKRFLGYATPVIDPTGSAVFEVRVPPLTAGALITATSTPGVLDATTSNFTPCLPATEAVALSIQRMGNEVELGWPSFATGNGLRSSHNLVGDWEPVTIAPVEIGGRLRLALPMNPQNRFFRLEQDLPPPNDHFVRTIPLTGVSGQMNGENTHGTLETGEPNHAGTSGIGSVWYRWEAPIDGDTTMTTAGSTFDTVLAVYRGGSLATLTPVAANDDVSASDATSRVTFSADEGFTYFIAIAGGDPAHGNFTLTWAIDTPPPPANDNFANAHVITGDSGSAAADSRTASKEPGEHDHAGETGGHSVWYQWTAPSSGSVTFATTDSDFDTTLAIYTGEVLASLTHITSNDDDGDELTSLVSFNAVAGTVYKIAVDGYDTEDVGSVVLTWSRP